MINFRVSFLVRLKVLSNFIEQYVLFDRAARFWRVAVGRSESDFSDSESLAIVHCTRCRGFSSPFQWCSMVFWCASWPFNCVFHWQHDGTHLGHGREDDSKHLSRAVPWCEEFADSFSSASKFSSFADEKGSLPLIFLAAMCKTQTPDLPYDRTQLIFPGLCAFSCVSVATNDETESPLSSQALIKKGLVCKPN